VLLARSAQEKAYLIWEKHRWNSFHFNFGNRTYWCSIDISVVQEKIDEYRRGRTRELKDIDSREEAIIRMEASREALGVEEIANCAFRVLYRQRDEATDETKFFLDIRYPSSKRARSRAILPPPSCASPRTSKTGCSPLAGCGPATSPS
jgi:hypothetical protein